jgi:hypothetical protein
MTTPRRPAPGDDWTVEPVLTGRDARRLAADPLDPMVVFAAVPTSPASSTPGPGGAHETHCP